MHKDQKQNKEEKLIIEAEKRITPAEQTWELRVGVRFFSHFASKIILISETAVLPFKYMQKVALLEANALPGLTTNRPIPSLILLRVGRGDQQTLFAVVYAKQGGRCRGCGYFR